MNKIIIGMLVLLIGGLMGACEKAKDKEEEVVFSHSAFDALLLQHVDAKGNVDYLAFKADESALKGLSRLLGRECPHYYLVGQ